MSGFSEASQDISSTAMRAAQERLNEIVQQDPDVATTSSRSWAGRSGAGNTGTVFVGLKPLRRTQGHRRRGDRAAAPQAGAHPGHHAVPAVGAGRARGRPRLAHAVPVHAGGRRPGRAADRGRRRCWQQLRKLPQLKDVNTDQQTAGLQLDVTLDRDTAVATGHHAAGDRRHAVRRLRAAPGGDVVHGANYYRVVLEATPAQQARPRASCTHIYVRHPPAAAGAAVERWRSFDPARDAAVGHAPGAVPGHHAVLQPGAGGGAGPGGRRRSTRAERQIGLPADAARPASRARRRRSGASLASEPMADRWRRCSPSTSCWACCTRA